MADDPAGGFVPESGFPPSKAGRPGRLDRIIINDLKVYAFHGVADEEKALGQMFTVSLSIGADLEKAAFSGKLDDTIDYSAVCATVCEALCSAKYDLIETAAMNFRLAKLGYDTLKELNRELMSRIEEKKKL